MSTVLRDERVTRPGLAIFPHVCKALIVALLAIGAMIAPADAADMLKIAVGNPGGWENAPAELGQKAGIFRKYGLELDIFYTQGSGETLQAVISGSTDIGIGLGVSAVMSAFVKGAPIQAIGNSTTGINEHFYYVPAASPIKTMADTNGKTVAYSSRGASSQSIAISAVKQAGTSAQLVATGNLMSTFTQVMSGQVDVGYGQAPAALDAVERGETRIIMTGADIPGFQNQTVRVLITNTGTIERRSDVITRFQNAYQEALDWLYTDDGTKAYAAWAKVSEHLAQRTRDQFYAPGRLRLAELSGLDDVMREGIAMKFLTGPLSKPQLEVLFAHYAKAK